MTPPPIESLVPHRGVMRLVAEVLASAADGSLLCRARVPALHPLAGRDGRASALLGLEMGAQAAAASQSLTLAGDGKAPRLGYLVGIRRAELAVAYLPVEADLEVEVRPGGSAPPLATFEVEVRLPAGGGLCVRGTISTYRLLDAEAERPG